MPVYQVHQPRRMLWRYFDSPLGLNLRSTIAFNKGLYTTCRNFRSILKKYRGAFTVTRNSTAPAIRLVVVTFKAGVPHHMMLPSFLYVKRTELNISLLSRARTILSVGYLIIMLWETRASSGIRCSFYIIAS